MQRRTLLSKVFGVVAGICTVQGLQGCAVSRVSEAALDPERGKAWRCQTCGYLTRSDEDLSKEFCPRCMTKKLREVTEEEFTKWLNA